jgi:hypothetical protein
MKRDTAKKRVLVMYPLAWFNSERRTIEGYSEGLILGYGDVNARSIEASAWKDAAARLKSRQFR